LKSTKYLIKNKCYIFAVLGVTVTTVIGAGLGSSFPKFLILKFGASTDVAAIASGSALLPSMFFGVMAGSIIMRRLPLKGSIQTAAKLCMVFSLLLGGFFGAFMIPGCKEPNIVGAALPYRNSSNSITMNSMCNQGCNCDRSAFNPGCGTDGMTYFSPCYAGCTANMSTNVYTNCSCIQATGDPGTVKKQLVLGECNRNCKNLYMFLASACIVALMAFVKATPHKMIVLRIVPENQRSYALGIQLLLVRTLGFIPSPVIIGAVIDSNCVLWSKTPCGKTGSCLAYQNERFSQNVAVFGGVCGAISLVAYTLVWYFYKADENEQSHEKLPENMFSSTETVSTNL